MQKVKEGTARERDAAILALAMGRCVGASDLLTGMKESELDPKAMEIVEAALAVLGGGNLHLIEDQVAEVTGSEIRRGRLFFRAVGAARRRFGRLHAVDGGPSTSPKPRNAGLMIAPSREHGWTGDS